jgi:hypothetical protein
VNLAWNDLGVWGSGAARVQVTYSYSDPYFGSGSKTDVVSLSVAEAARGASIVLTNGYATAVTLVKVEKYLGGSWVTVLSSGGDTANSSLIVWEKPAVTGAQIGLQYRAQGSTGAWTSATVYTRGDRCWVDLSTQPADRYEYVLTYTRPGESTPYAQGSGVFMLDHGTDTAGRNVTASVATPYLDIGPVVKAVTAADGSASTAAVNLAWSDLGVWGSGAARALVTYNYPVPLLGTQTATQTVTLTAAEAAHGASVVLGSGAATAVTRVQLQKSLGGSWVTVIDSTTDVVKPRQLLVRGSTAGLTALQVYDGTGALVRTYTPGGAGVTTLATKRYFRIFTDFLDDLDHFLAALFSQRRHRDTNNLTINHGT